MRGVDPYPYDRDGLVMDLATGDGMTYDDFDQLYGMDVVEADTAVRDLKHTGYDIERVETERGRAWMWSDPFEVLDGR